MRQFQLRAALALGGDELGRMDAYCRVDYYRSVGQIYLDDNALLCEPLKLADIAPDERERLFRASGWNLYVIEGDDAATMHELMAVVMEKVIADIKRIQANARSNKVASRPGGPMILRRSPKGRMGPTTFERRAKEGIFCAQQISVRVDRAHLPELKIRVITVVDLMKLQSESEHPHGLSDWDDDWLSTTNKHIIFGFHGYPWLVPRLTYHRANRNLHVRVYKEEGTTTTAFDMRVQNDMDRFHRVQDVVDRLPQLASKGVYLKKLAHNKRVEHKLYINRSGKELPETRN